MLDLEAIKAGCEAATPGPWVNTGGRFPKINGGPIGGCDVATLFFADGADAAFIAAAREDVPALVAEVERLRDVILAASRAVTGLELEAAIVKAQAVAAEREACAAIADYEADEYGPKHPAALAAFAVAASIRARGNQ